MRWDETRIRRRERTEHRSCCWCFGWVHQTLSWVGFHGNHGRTKNRRRERKALQSVSGKRKREGNEWMAEWFNASLIPSFPSLFFYYCSLSTAAGPLLSLLSCCSCCCCWSVDDDSPLESRNPLTNERTNEWMDALICDVMWDRDLN